MPANRDHWENIYRTKRPDEVSWTQDIPKISLDFVRGLHLASPANIIDIGGGDGRLVDCLLAEGFENITVLDISEGAIQRAEARLGDGAGAVQWVAGDVLEFQPATKYDLWHDRAMFHFLTTESEITRYLTVAATAVKDGGYLIIGTFSNTGPEKCSGLDVRRYSREALTEQLSGHGFEKIQCVTEDHITPFKTAQNFLFCSFRKNSR